MKIEMLIFDKNQWSKYSGDLLEKEYSLVNVVFVYGHTDIVKREDNFKDIKEKYPNARIVGCSTSGNVMEASLTNYELTATAVYLEKSSIEISSISFNEKDNVEELSKELISKLSKENLKHIFIMSDGLLINGSSLTRGINKVSSVSVTGGMAGDGDRFLETFVVVDGIPKQKTIVAIGFYGDNLSITTGCFAGWSEFGTVRTITKSEGNVLYEIDGEPALDLYKKYLGELADELPNSGLRFPLSIRENKNTPEVIRTLLAIDEEKKSITYAGDVPVGYSARLMKADIDALIDGAGEAAHAINKVNDNTALGLIVSCVGRKIVMNYLVEDELEVIQDYLGENVKLTGFYSYGEIAPFKDDINICELHNQTMTLTAIYES